MGRAGLLFLLGQAGDRSDQTLGILSAAADQNEPAQRRAAALSLIRLQALPPEYGTYESIVELYYTDDLEKDFEALPWDACGEIDRDSLINLLDRASRDQIYNCLITAMECGDFSVPRISSLINMLFPLSKGGHATKVTARILSSQQRRLVQVMVRLMEGGKRIFFGHFPCWGLPHTMREWRALAAGHEPAPVDETLPLLASAQRPRKPLRARKLQVGDRVIHRYFGHGTVLRIQVQGPSTELIIMFDDEGEMQLALLSDG